VIGKHFNIWQHLVSKEEYDGGLPVISLDTCTKSTPDFSSTQLEKFKFENESVADEQVTWGNYSVHK